MGTCYTCGGTGIVECSGCSGKGYVYYNEDNRPPCNQCYGSGKVDCPDCGGSGSDGNDD